MDMSVIYIDTSIFLRACLADATDHVDALELLLHSDKPLVSSELLWLEADRAAIRLAQEDPNLATLPTQVTRALTHVDMIPWTRAILNDARQIQQTVKTLDAIHIASVESIAGILDYVATSDKTMLAVLKDRGVATHPSSE